MTHPEPLLAAISIELQLYSKPADVVHQKEDPMLEELLNCCLSTYTNKELSYSPDGGNSACPGSPTWLCAGLAEKTATAAHTPNSKKHSKLKVPSRCSARQAARHSSVPVSKRGQVRLMREMGIISQEEPFGEAAMKAYISSFDSPLPEHIVLGLHKLTRLDGGIPSDFVDVEDLTG
ncbi:hypothetical protein ABZP36_013103 [Zizania latifolia]